MIFRLPRFVLGWIILISIGVLLAGCAAASQSAPTVTAALQGLAPQPSPTAIPTLTSVPLADPLAPTPAGPAQTLRFAWTQEPVSLNPYYAETWQTSVLHSLYLCWPWQYDSENRAYPHLVTAIPSLENGGVSPDGLEITLQLRNDIRWSDGEPITSADFAFTYAMALAPENNFYSQYPYNLLSALETPNPQTVVMQFTEPFIPWQANFWHGILPAHILAPVYAVDGSLQAANWNEAPTVGCGPYNFVDWSPGGSLRFEKNLHYWLPTPKIDALLFQFVPEGEQTIALAAGDAEVSVFPPLLDIPILQDMGFSVFPINSGYVEGWFFNFRDSASPGMQDPAVRRAIAQAIDRDAIVNNLLLGFSERANTFWDPLLAQGFVSPAISPWEYDLAAANDLLTQNGYRDRDGDGIREDPAGQPLALVLGATTKPLRQEIQAYARQQLRLIGIDLTIQDWTPEEFYASYAEGGPLAVGAVDIMQWSDKTYFPDPDIDYWLCALMPAGTNPWGYNYFGCDPDLDALFQAQMREIDPAARQAIIQTIGRIIHDEVYWFGLYADLDFWVVDANLTGVQFSGVTPFYNIADWEFVE